MCQIALVLFCRIAMVECYESACQTQFELCLRNVTIGEEGIPECKLELTFLGDKSDFVTVRDLELRHSFSGDFVVVGISNVAEDYIEICPKAPMAQYAGPESVLLSPGLKIVGTVQLSSFLNQNWFALNAREREKTLQEIRVAISLSVDAAATVEWNPYHFFICGSCLDGRRNIRVTSVPR